VDGDGGDDGGIKFVIRGDKVLILPSPLVPPPPPPISTTSSLQVGKGSTW